MKTTHKRPATSNQRLKVAIIGSDNKASIALIQKLLNHPHTELTTITSREHAKKRLDHVFPFFLGESDLVFSSLNIHQIGRQHQVVFLNLPPDQSMEIAFKLRGYGAKIIDLSPAYRFQNVKTYQKLFGKHQAKKLLKEACYGLTEIFSEDIKEAMLVAIPDAMATSVILALAPLLQNQMIVPTSIICSIKQQKGKACLCGQKTTRVRAEIEEKLAMLAGKDITITLDTQDILVENGLLNTVYVHPIRKWKNEKLIKTYRTFYKNSPYIQILDDTLSCKIDHVMGTDHIHVGLNYDDHSEKLIITTALDKLGKGSASAAVQCLSLMI
jgi:N-acetyl-gamma-glutamyl-phosphate reductase